MAYPKPLSDKNIKKLLDAWDSKTVELILNHYKLCADLYGVINLEAAWVIAESINLPVKEDEFYRFSDVARRMSLPFYVMNAAELYKGCGHQPRLFRLIVNAQLVTHGTGKYRLARLLDYHQSEILSSLPYFTEQNLPKIAADMVHMEKLQAYLDALHLPDGTRLCDDYRGMRPIDTLLNLVPEGSLVPKDTISTSEKLVKMMILECHVGLSESFQHVQFYLKKLGVVHEVETMFEIMIDCFRQSRWWSFCGYTPAEVELLDEGDEDFDDWKEQLEPSDWKEQLEPSLESDNVQRFIDFLEKISSLPIKEIDMDVKLTENEEADGDEEWLHKDRNHKYN